MSNRDLIKRVMAKTATVQKTAAFPPFAENGPPPSDDDGGGAEGANSAKRNIPKDHPYDPKALKPMATALWAASVSLGHALTAYRHLSRLKSATISPDGMLGGRGYVMGVPDVRKKLYAACEALSAITDTLHDEITAPHWRPRLAMLDESDAEDIERYVEKSQGILEDPEKDVEEEESEIEGGKDGEKKDTSKKPEAASSMPDGGGNSESSQAVSIVRSKEASSDHYNRQSNSSVSPSSLPGPRVEHLDRELQEAPQMAYDGWGYPGMVQHQPDDGQGDLSDRGAGSAMPGSLTDTTPTEAYDFGLGFGANGQGAGGYGNPSGEGDGKTKGVFGPTSGLPGTPAGSSGDTTPAFDAAVSDRHSMDSLPNDGEPPVARSDYYQGDKGNLVNDGGTLSQSEMPAEATPAGEFSPSMMNTDYTHTDLETPYVRYDFTTPVFRAGSDPQLARKTADRIERWLILAT